MHPEIQEKAVKELEEVYEHEDTVTDFEKLSRLPYLEMIVKEASKWHWWQITSHHSVTFYLNFSETIPRSAIFIKEMFGRHSDK